MRNKCVYRMSKSILAHANKHICIVFVYHCHSWATMINTCDVIIYINFSKQLTENISHSNSHRSCRKGGKYDIKLFLQYWTVNKEIKAVVLLLFFCFLFFVFLFFCFLILFSAYNRLGNPSRHISVLKDVPQLLNGELSLQNSLELARSSLR